MMKKKKNLDRLAKSINKLIKQDQDLERISKTGATEKDLLKFKADALGISQKTAKKLFGDR